MVDSTNSARVNYHDLKRSILMPRGKVCVLRLPYLSKLDVDKNLDVQRHLASNRLSDPLESPFRHLSLVVATHSFSDTIAGITEWKPPMR